MINQMKHLKRYNENNYESGNIQEVIDRILDNLSKKKKLSNSEKEFMDEASKGTIVEISEPKMTGNFWADMSNPHNLGTLWIGKDSIWKELKSVEDEEDELINSTEDSNKKWELKKQASQKRIVERVPGLKEYLIELAQLQIKQSKEQVLLYQKYKKIQNKITDDNLKYELSTKMDYAHKGIESLENQFGYAIGLIIDDDGEYHLDK